MANVESKRVPEDVPGDFFVDSTCIDCDTCRQVAPAVFAEADDHAFVQPPAGRRPPTAATPCTPWSAARPGRSAAWATTDPAAVMDDFPLPIEGPVFYCGFNSPKSYGGNSYFVRHPDGNWLIDSPEVPAPAGAAASRQLGGVAHIFLTHRDDVADAGLYAEHFGSRRIIHRAELHSQPGAEVVLDGDEPVRTGPRLPGDPDAGPHRGALRPAVRRPLPVHRRPPRLGPARPAARRRTTTTAGTPGRSRSSRCAAGRRTLRVGAAGPRPARAPARATRCGGRWRTSSRGCGG